MLKQLLDIHELLDGPSVTGESVASHFRSAGMEVTVTPVEGDNTTVDVLSFKFAGAKGRSGGGSAPTLGVIGRLGGIAMRPARIGLVSDADGALVALTCAAKLAAMRSVGDLLEGDVIVTTSICASALLETRDGVERVSAPVHPSELVPREVDVAMEAILSVDTTRGNRLVNSLGIAITPTVKEGYILRVSEDLLDITEIVTGRAPLVLPLTDQDITPYEHGLYHINSIMQPSLYSDAPVVGLALTTAASVPGTATGATQLGSIEAAARYCIEAAKAFGAGRAHFYSDPEWRDLVRLYGRRNYRLPGGAVAGDGHATRR